MPNMVDRFLRPIGAVVLMGYVMTLGGCVVTPQPVTDAEIRQRMQRDLDAYAKGQEPVTGPIDLYSAMARALKYNLNVRVELMEKGLAQQQLDLAHYSLLPRLVAGAGYDGRDSFYGASSRSLFSGLQSLEQSTSSDRDLYSGDLALSWNVLDFGLSYIRAQQAANDVLIADEEKRRVAIRVVQEVRSAYWKAVSAERLLPDLAALNQQVGKALDTAKTVRLEGLDNPLTQLQYQRDLLNIQREAQRIYRDLSTAKVQLASLMNLPPGSNYDIAVPARETPIREVADTLESLEMRALYHRPELRQVDYRLRINSKEAKAAILEMLPSLNLQIGSNYNSNSFLFYNNWLNYGARISWNLLSLFRQPAKFKTIQAQREIFHARSLALTMAVLSQVHVATAQYAVSKQEYKTAKEYAVTQSEISTHTHINWVNNRVSEQNVIKERVHHVLAELRYDASRAEMEAAYAAMLATIGEDPLPETIGGHDLAKLAKALQARWEGDHQDGQDRTLLSIAEDHGVMNPAKIETKDQRNEPDRTIPRVPDTRRLMGPRQSEPKDPGTVSVQTISRVSETHGPIGPRQSEIRDDRSEPRRETIRVSEGDGMMRLRQIGAKDYGNSEPDRTLLRISEDRGMMKPEMIQLR